MADVNQQGKQKKNKEELKLENRKKGRGKRFCQICGARDGLIRAYNLYICRRCFRECAYDLGFKKYS
ncbi:MAG: 30S ribosomal protein S14 [Candidatus Micrarchaeota archaeon]|nr:30S ribosomal protein S14 [Candidatus Micrarchaeota archaeon]